MASKIGMRAEWPMKIKLTYGWPYEAYSSVNNKENVLNFKIKVIYYTSGDMKENRATEWYVHHVDKIWRKKKTSGP